MTQQINEQLVLAAHAGDKDRVVQLLHSGVPVDERDRDGGTALMQAIVSGHTELVRFLIAQGADINAQRKDEWTPLHFAAQGRNVEMIRLLLDHHADHTVKENHGNTALFVAVMNSQGEGDVIRALLECGANPDEKNNYDVTPRALANTIANYDLKQFFA